MAKKHIILLGVSFIILLSAISCAKDKDGSFERKDDPQIEQNNKVSFQDVEDYLNYYKKVSTTKSADFSINPLIYKGDTVMYLLNYGKGWEVLSADKRTPMKLIESNSGTMTQEALHSNPAIDAFMSGLSDGLYKIINDPLYDAPASVSGEWPLLRDSSSFMGNRIVRILASVDTIVLSSKLQDHLLETKWGQSSPWNQYAPYRDSTMTTHCYTGCVPVAASQVLYYLHYKLGIPTYTYGSAECSAILPSQYAYLTLNDSNVVFSNWEDDFWDEMPLSQSGSTGFDKVSALMVWLGKLYGAHYRYTGTGAYTGDATSVFPSVFNISCQSYDIDSNNLGGYTSIIENEVKNREIPVLMSITDTDAAGHSIVVDGYNYKKTKYIYHYESYITGDDGIIMPWQHPYTTWTVESIDESTSIAINWGWNGVCDSIGSDTIWYNAYAGWLAAGYNFNMKNYLVYGFSEMNL